MDTEERLKGKCAPAGLEVVGLGVSDESLEGHLAQTRHVSGQQDLQAGQDSVAQLTGLQQHALHQKLQELGVLQLAHLQANQHKRQHAQVICSMSFLFYKPKKSIIISHSVPLEPP